MPTPNESQDLSRLSPRGRKVYEKLLAEGIPPRKAYEVAMWR